MRTLVYFVIPTGKIVGTPSGGSFKMPVVPAGKTLSWAIRFLDVIDGQFVEVARGVRNLRGWIGNGDARPESGRFAIKVGVGAITDANTTALLDWNADQMSWETALNGVSAKPAAFTVRTAPGCKLVRCGAGLQVALEVVRNGLTPDSFGHVRGYQEASGEWVYEVRLKQSPFAFTDVFSRGDAPEPTLTVKAEGYTDGSGSYLSSEIQKLSIPPDFRAGYFIRDPRSNVRTRQLRSSGDAADSADDLAAAINAILPAGETVTVEDVTTTGAIEADITFGGDAAGVDMPLFEILVAPDAPPGDVTLSLPVTLPAVYAALRDKEQIPGVPFELTFDLLPEAADESNPDIPADRCKTVGLKVTIARPADWDGLATADQIRFLRPPSSPGYIPTDPSQVGAGQLAYEQNIGDGATTDFVIDHNLGSQSLTGFVLVDRTNGKILRAGFETFEIDENSFRIEFTAAPSDKDAGGGVKVLVATPQTLEVFLAGLAIMIGQVTGLQDYLDNLSTRLAAVETVLPSTGPGTTAASGTALAWAPSPRFSIFPKATDPAVLAVLAGLKITGSGDDAALPAINDALLPRPGYLLRALHDAVVSDQTGGDPVPSPSSQTNQVLVSVGDPTEIDGGGGIRGSIVPESGLFGSDGRIWYQVHRYGTSRSYYPIPFERTFFELDINDEQLAVGATFDLQFRLGLQLLRANCAGFSQVVIEFGVFTATTGGSPTAGPNLQAVTWDTATPALSQTINLSGEALSHRFGVRVKRSVSGLACDQLVYGRRIGGAPAPASANFAVRARLIQFDTEDIADPRGFLFTAFYDAKASISS